jgi:hypothetical protein
MLSINLVPEVKKEQAKLKKINLTVTTVAVVVGGILLAAVLLISSLLGYRTVRIGTVKGNITKIEGELEVYKELEESVNTLENGLADIKKIVSGGRNWTEFFAEIENATPADIQFTNFQVSGNTISASVKGKEVKSIDRFIKSFTNYQNSAKTKMFANVVVDGYTVAEGGMVSFQAKFDVVGETK